MRWDQEKAQVQNWCPSKQVSNDPWKPERKDLTPGGMLYCRSPPHCCCSWEMAEKMPEKNPPSSSASPLQKKCPFLIKHVLAVKVLTTEWPFKKAPRSYQDKVSLQPAVVFYSFINSNFLSFHIYLRMVNIWILRGGVVAPDDDVLYIISSHTKFQSNLIEN